MLNNLHVIMKHKSILYFLILLFITLIGLWGVPALVKKATVSKDAYPFAYYSSILKELCFIDYKRLSVVLYSFNTLLSPISGNAA